uniref:Uncharacterized protein n=1 Tax=Kalanchoe fedtschenkoi TaxID=63787 RepID=A0A7N0RET6_KALFE
MPSTLIRLPLCATIALLILFTASSPGGVLAARSLPGGLLGHQSRLTLQLDKKDREEAEMTPPPSSSLAGSERSQPVADLRHGLAFRSLMKGRTTPSAPSRKVHSAPTSRRHLLSLSATTTTWLVSFDRLRFD